MEQTFDLFGQPELPDLTLTNPNKDELYSLGLAYDIKIIKRFNALSELDFIFPQSIDGGTTTLEAYSYLQNKRLVYLENEGYFQIDNVEESMDGSVSIKHVECKSLENELISKRVVGLGGTFAFYNPITPNNTFMKIMLDHAPTWSIGYIDSELWEKYRTFDISDSNVYETLMNDASKAYDCVFVFDTIEKTISAYATFNATVQTDIFLSFDNVLVNADFSEKSDEICTSLSVSGKGDLTIAGVNPFGMKIYDFSYYKKPQWMSQALIDALDDWEALVDYYQPIYASFLLTLKGYKAEMIDLEGDLEVLEAEYVALEGVQKVRIEGGLNYSDITAQMQAKQAQINAQNALIGNKQAQIDGVNDDLADIVIRVSFASNFTPSQLIELNGFIYENTYNNSNIIVTDSMTTVEVQEQQQRLYDQAVGVLAKVSQPRYELVLESINYTALPEFLVFTSQTELGCVVTAELEDGTFVETVLLEIRYQIDDPTNFQMTFSNRLRLDGAGFSYSDLMGEVTRMGSSVTFNSSLWSNWNDEHKDDVTQFITSALNAANNEIINSDNQEIVINKNGLRGRTFNPTTGGYKNEQVWLTSSILAFTDNNWQSSKLALGKIAMPGGGTAYGLAADVLVGRLLAGNSLIITNQNNSFTVNGTGATLTNATLNVTSANSRIYLDPTNAFKIQKNQGGSWIDKFSVTTSGDIVFSGTLSGASGSFSGSITAGSGSIGALIIDSLGLQYGSNYLRGNDLKWGALTITGNSASFDGTIRADKIIGAVVDGQIASGLNADKVTFGTLRAVDIYGSRIMWDGVIMDTFSSGFPYIQANYGIRLQETQNNNYIELTPSYIYLKVGSAGNGLVINDNHVKISHYLYSNISGDGGYGYSDTLRIQTNTGYKYFVFDNGILTNVY